MRRWKKVFHENGNQKKPGVAILLSDKIDFKIKRLCLFVTRDKEGHYTLIKESIQEEDITIINIYASNIGATKYIKQILTDIKGEIDSNTIIVGYLNIPLTSVDRSTKQNINKETVALNDTLHQMVLIDICRTFYQINKQKTPAEYTFISSAHGTFSRTDHILGHKSSLGKFKKIEIVSSIVSDHNAMRLEINYRQNTVKNTNTWRQTVSY